MGVSRKFKACLYEKGSDQSSEVEWRTNKNYLVVKSNGNEAWRLYLDDILDIQLSSDLILISYPLINQKRERKVYSIRSDELKSFESILRAAWTPNLPPHLRDDKTIDELKLLILINPFSGRKEAEYRWEKMIRPLFNEMRITCEIRRTERTGHATEIIQNLDINNYRGVAVLSGDGLILEVLNGILMRPDYRRALKFPIVHLPLGTSNALAAAIAYQSGEPFSPRGLFCKEIALMCARPAYRSLRLNHVQTAEDGDWAMFLSATWGLMADIDLGSERFRWAGMIRLHIEAFIRIATILLSGLPQLARYRGRISYKAVENKQLLRNTMIKAEDAIKKLGKRHFRSTTVELVESDVSINEERTIKSAFRGTQLVADENGKIPQLNEPIPSDWTVIEGEFAYITISSISHLGSDLPYIPSAKLDEEVFYLTLVDWRVLKTRLHMGHLLITIDRGSHLDHTCLHIIPVIACRVEPERDAGGYVAIDGEPCKPGKAFQVFSTSLQATVIGRDIR